MSEPIIDFGGDDILVLDTVIGLEGITVRMPRGSVIILDEERASCDIHFCSPKNRISRPFDPFLPIFRARGDRDSKYACLYNVQGRSVVRYHEYKTTEKNHGDYIYLIQRMGYRTEDGKDYRLEHCREDGRRVDCCAKALSASPLITPEETWLTTIATESSAVVKIQVTRDEVIISFDWTYSKNWGIVIPTRHDQELGAGLSLGVLIPPGTPEYRIPLPEGFSMEPCEFTRPARPRVIVG